MTTTDNVTVNATPDQLVSIGAMISRDWGETGYRIESIHSYSSEVTAARVRCSDGGRFVVLATRWGQTDSVQIAGYADESWNAPAIMAAARELHGLAVVAAQAAWDGR